MSLVNGGEAALENGKAINSEAEAEAKLARRRVAPASEANKIDTLAVCPRAR
jgi:hypothetical protein